MASSSIFMRLVECNFGPLDHIRTDGGQVLLVPANGTKFVENYSEQICSVSGLKHWDSGWTDQQSQWSMGRYSRSLISNLSHFVISHHCAWAIIVKPSLCIHTERSRTSTCITTLYRAWLSPCRVHQCQKFDNCWNLSLHYRESSRTENPCHTSNCSNVMTSYRM